MYNACQFQCSNVYDTEDECIQHYEESHMPAGIDLEHCEAEDSDEFEDGMGSVERVPTVTSDSNHKNQTEFQIGASSSILAPILLPLHFHIHTNTNPHTT